MGVRYPLEGVKIKKKILITEDSIYISIGELKLIAVLVLGSNEQKVCKIDDIQGGNYKTEAHRKGTGTKLVFVLYKYLESQYGKDFKVFRSGIYHELNDPQSVKDCRVSFWNKVGLVDTSEKTVIDCLKVMRKNRIVIRDYDLSGFERT